jgi:hypothetical protein
MNLPEDLDLTSAVDALRSALGDNPLVLMDADDDGVHERHYFSDAELENALRSAVQSIPEQHIDIHE